MKKILITAAAFLLAGSLLNSQTIENTGKPIAEIFTDFHYNLAQDSITSGFNLNRAYFGYNYVVNENFSATIKVNIGSPEDLAPGSVARRYAFYREASITYAKDKLSLSMGIIGTRLFDYQQKFWGKRYVANTYQALNGYGYVADLGVVADYKFNDIIDADFMLMNGEGYSNIQLDNDLKSSAGITLTPVKQLAVRVYDDLMRHLGIWQTTFVGFAGFKNDVITIGAEISYKSNLDLTEGHDAWGISGTGALGLSKKIEFFTRYDYSTSVTVPGDTTQWNYNKDGSFLISGFQYTFNKIVKVALDYQATFPVDNTRSFNNLIFLNALFKF
jgi:hypothetical protein